MPEHFLTYHNFEETMIAICCAIVAGRALRLFASRQSGIDEEQKSRFLLVGAAFVILALSSLIHALIHALDFDLNLLYQTLLGYCLGFLTLIIAISTDQPRARRIIPLLYLPLLLLLAPDVHQQFPLFGEFRPLVWISVAYLSGVICMLFVAIFYRTKDRHALLSAIGFLFIFTSSIFLFFPSAIGTPMWLHGHLFRPVGFIVLLFGMNAGVFRKLDGSILYRALTAFSLLAAIPLLVIGTVIFYEIANPLDLEGRRFLVFVLMLVTFVSALVFGMGMIIRLIRPILFLKESVDRLVDERFSKKIEINGNDEIGELSRAFNKMVARLNVAIEEQERYCRLAATGELAATLAHELKNPLNAIGGAASYIGRNYKGQIIEEFTTIISEEVSRINKLATNLLCFAKPLNYESEPNDINKIAQETVSLLNNEAVEQGIRLQLRSAADRTIVNCDYNQVKQVLINLIINAFDAIEGPGEVTVSIAGAHDQVTVTVKDTGSGIRPAGIKNIFNPFFTTKTRGTGLGLAISKKIAREHGGDLIVESVYGKGSEFTLSLPGRSAENVVSNPYCR